MDDRMTISEAIDALIGYGPAVWIGVLAAIVTFIIEVILCTKGIIFAGGEKKIERARKEGKYAQGTLVELLYQNREPEGKTVNRLYSGIYEYTVEGITRTKRVVEFLGMLPLGRCIFIIRKRRTMSLRSMI